MPNLDIDLNKISDLGLTLNQYVFLKSHLPNKVKGIKNYVKNHITNEDVSKLIELGYIDNTSSLDSVNFTDLWYSMNMGEYNDDWFKSFHERFPTSVNRPDGSKDYLRTNLNRCRALYREIVKDNYDTHLRLCSAVDKEIQLKRKYGKMSFFRRMDNWLKNESWLEIEAIDENPTNNIQTYGTTIA